MFLLNFLLTMVYGALNPNRRLKVLLSFYFVFSFYFDDVEVFVS